MKRLSYDTLKETGEASYYLKEAPERVLQFGEGNFLRAFVDYFIDNMNEKAGFNGKVVVVQPIPQKEGMLDTKQFLNEQDGLYTLYLRGRLNGEPVMKKRLISCISRCINAYSDYDALLACAKNPSLRFIVSNTTEAGITYDPSCQFTDRPASSYPGKLTQFLYERFQAFEGKPGSGFLLIPCELITDNGKQLRSCVEQYARQWELGEDFLAWIEKENHFCCTLVDRIVTGYPAAEAAGLNEQSGYEDKMIDTGEIFGFWAIEGPACLGEEMPFAKAELPVLIADDISPYKQRKVRILNGAHTSMSPGAILSGLTTVGECMEDETIHAFLEKAIYQEIVPTLTLPREEVLDFAGSVTDRFANPYIRHALASICLNTTSKWKERVLPTLTDYQAATGALPVCLSASLAMYVAFYRGVEGITSPVNDSAEVISFFEAHKQDSLDDLAEAVCDSAVLWGEPITVPGLKQQLKEDLALIYSKGAKALFEKAAKA